MSTGRLHLDSVVPGLRLAALLTVLVGLFGMHGLDGHHAVVVEDVPSAAMADMPMGPASFPAEVVAGAGHLTDHVELGAPVVVAAVSDTGHGGMDMGMAAMCVAILAAALFALVRILFARRGRSVLWVVPRRAGAGLQHPGRDPDPPSLTSLSILRC